MEGSNSLLTSKYVCSFSPVPFKFQLSVFLIQGMADIENKLTRLGVIQVPVRAGNQFFGEAGLWFVIDCVVQLYALSDSQDMYYGIRDINMPIYDVPLKVPSLR
jgi:hypothetical protein